MSERQELAWAIILACLSFIAALVSVAIGLVTAKTLAGMVGIAITTNASTSGAKLLEMWFVFVGIGIAGIIFGCVLLASETVYRRVQP